MNIKQTNLAAKIEEMENADKMAPFPIYGQELINDLKQYTNMITKKSDYNNVKVTYCTSCLSLKVKPIPYDPNKQSTEVSDPCYCGSCGNTDTEQAHIHDWERLYEEKYDVKFLDQ